MIHILDSDLREKLLIIEGKGFEYDLDRKPEESSYSLLSVIREFQERCLEPLTFEDEEDLNDYNYYLTNIVSIGPIYGLGGWNRYFVYGTGEVKISERLSTEKALTKAVTLGFSVHQ
jgi:hypothetical protein